MSITRKFKFPTQKYKFGRTNAEQYYRLQPEGVAMQTNNKKVDENKNNKCKSSLMFQLWSLQDWQMYQGSFSKYKYLI